MKRADGSILSANFPAHNRLSQNKVDRDYGIYRCMVKAVLYVDDVKNTTFKNKQVTYEVVILGGMQEGQIIPNVKAMNFLGGENNYSERIFRALESPLSGPGRKVMADQKGDIVYVGYTQGDKTAPIIIGCGTQPLDEDKTGATIADGPRWVEEYNGLKREINKLGELLLTQKTGTLDADKNIFVPDAADTFEQKESWETGEKHTREFKSGLKVAIDGVADSYKVTASGGASILAKAGKVAIGTSATELIQQISDSLEKLVTVFTAVKGHIHTAGNLGYPVSGPDTTADWATAASELATIKGLIDSIKGTL